MAVTSVGAPELVLFGSLDDRFPIGYWFATQIATGDLSGGEVIARIQFAGPTAPVIPLAYTCDYLAGQAEADLGCTLQIAGFSLQGPDGQSTNIVYAADIISSSGGQFTTPGRDVITQEILMGQPIVGQTAAVDAQFPTNNNGQNYRVYAKGKVYRASSLRVKGGLNFGGAPVSALSEQAPGVVRVAGGQIPIEATPQAALRAVPVSNLGVRPQTFFPLPAAGLGIPGPTPAQAAFIFSARGQTTQALVRAAGGGLRFPTVAQRVPGQRIFEIRLGALTEALKRVQGRRIFRGLLDLSL